MDIQKIVQEIIAKKKAGQTPLDSVFFVGCGGSYAAQFPAKYLLDHESKSLRTAMYTANEFVYAPPKACGPSSLVIACSMRGTKETGEAVKAAAKTGADIISFYVQESEMTRASTYMVPYTSIAEDSNRFETSNGSQILHLAFELLNQTDGFEYYEAAMAGFDVIDDIYRRAKEYSLPRAERFGQETREDDMIYVMGAGPSTYAAYIFSVCNLMEMQWVHSPTVNFGELLHGPFETVDKNLPIVCLLSEGRTRPMDERAMRFLEKYGERLYVLDAKELGINRIHDRVCEYFCPLLFSALLQNVYLHEMAHARRHPISTRRYMWKVEY